MADLKKLAEDLVNLSVKDVNELATILKDEYNIEPAAAAAPVMMAGPAGGDGADAVEEKTEFEVVLKAAGGAKLKVVKELKSLLGLSLTDAKAMADGAPSSLKTGVPKDEAENIKKTLEELGAEIELK